jgi:hypothetical protein
MALVTVEQSTSDPREIVLTIKKDEFGSFVQDLLSQNKTIERDINGSFTLDASAISDVVSAIEQRVKLQNQVMLSTASFSTSYVDGYEQKVESLHAFQNFRDTRQAEVCGIECNLTYLILFPGRSKPEKQAVSFGLLTPKYFTRRDSTRSSSPLTQIFTLMDSGRAHVEIEYTDVSWGMDLENLVSQMLLSKIKREWHALSLLRGVAVVYAPIVIFLGGLALFQFLQQQHLAAKKHEIWSALEKSMNRPVLDLISQKLNYIFDPTLTDLSIHELTPVILQLLGAAVALLSIFLLAARRPGSFLLLNDFTKVVWERQVKKREFIKVALGVSFIVGTIASVAASFIYDYLTK